MILFRRTLFNTLIIFKDAAPVTMCFLYLLSLASVALCTYKSHRYFLRQHCLQVVEVLLVCTVYSEFPNFLVILTFFELLKILELKGSKWWPKSDVNSTKSTTRDTDLDQNLESGCGSNVWNIMCRKSTFQFINTFFLHITVSYRVVTHIRGWQHVTGLVNLQSTRSSVRPARLYGSKCSLNLCPNQLKGTGRESRRASEKGGIFPTALGHWTVNTFP